MARHRLALVALAAAALALTPLAAVSATAAPTTAAAPTASADRGHGAMHGVRVCARTTAAGMASCNAEVLVDSAGKPVAPAAISGKTPADIQSAYGLTDLSSGGRTVAIVDAYGYPRAEADLATYRAQMGLPTCTTADGCLKIVNQTGGSKLPRFNLGWAQEQALDLDAVSAACPDCKILLVQASSASIVNLGTAVNTASRAAGVVAISNSYGGGDLADSSYGSYYNHPGIAVTASTGDYGYAGASFPASSKYVVAVGGTTLTSTDGTWTESVWSGTGSGCTTKNTAPSGQSSSVTHCSGRAIADVAAVADPATGLAVYAPTSSSQSGWAQYGGTSLSSPIVASVFALSGNTSGYPASTLYSYGSGPGLYDVTSGSNGTCTYWCVAGTGWDGPTGLGSPRGTSAF